MAMRRVVMVGLGLLIGGSAPGVEAGPIGRKLQEWTQRQPQVYTAQPSQTRNIDLNLSQATVSERVRQKLPWRKSKSMTSGYQMKTEYMKHRNDGTLVH